MKSEEKEVPEPKESGKSDSAAPVEKEKKSKVGGSIPTPVPESLYPALCK